MRIEDVILEVLSEVEGQVMTPTLVEYLADRCASKAHVARLLRDPIEPAPVYIGEWPPRVVRRVRYNERQDRITGGVG